MAAREHLGGYVPGGDPWTRCDVLWRWLANTLEVRSVIDVGCGDGIAVDCFAQLGVDAHGVDGVPQSDERIVCHDYTTGVYDPGRDFDLGWCCEFVEHVDARHVENFLTTFRRCQVLLLTHAFPGQRGHHHVNCQPPRYWLDRLAADFEPDGELTVMTRGLCTPPNHYARSGLAFRRRR